MEKSLTTEEQDAELRLHLTRKETEVVLKEQQNSQLRNLLEEKQQLVQRLERFLREVEQESARIDQAIAQATQLTPSH